MCCASLWARNYCILLRSINSPLSTLFACFVYLNLLNCTMQFYLLIITIVCIKGSHSFWFHNYFQSLVYSHFDSHIRLNWCYINTYILYSCIHTQSLNWFYECPPNYPFFILILCFVLTKGFQRREVWTQPECQNSFAWSKSTQNEGRMDSVYDKWFLDIHQFSIAMFSNAFLKISINCNFAELYVCCISKMYSPVLFAYIWIKCK